MNTVQPSTEPADQIEKLVPTAKAYFGAFALLFVSGIAGGLIGYAMMKVFFPSFSSLALGIGTCIICGLIVYGVSVITSLGLAASVEWKARKSTGPEKARPSRMLHDQSN